MTEEEYFRKYYPDSCYGDKPLSPHWDFFQDGVEFGERQSEKKIAELEKENAELKEKLKPENCLKSLAKSGLVKFTCENGNEHDQLTKAKEILHKVCYEFGIYNKDIMVEAKQFLKEYEK